MCWFLQAVTSWNHRDQTLHSHLSFIFVLEKSNSSPFWLCRKSREVFLSFMRSRKDLSPACMWILSVDMIAPCIDNQHIQLLYQKRLFMDIKFSLVPAVIRCPSKHNTSSRQTLVVARQQSFSPLTSLEVSKGARKLSQDLWMLFEVLRPPPEINGCLWLPHLCWEIYKSQNFHWLAYHKKQPLITGKKF